MGARHSRSDLVVPLRVYKFGGTSVGTPEAVRAAVDIVRAAAPNVFVVVSATSGTTDLLIGAAKCALRADDTEVNRAADAFEARHVELIRELVSAAAAADELLDVVREETRELRAICQSILVLRELTARTMDFVVARGERLMARIFAAALAQARVPCRYVEATRVIHTRMQLGSLWPDFVRTLEAAQTEVRPFQQKQIIVVMPGYVGRGPSGETVTLGRGGSDFSAAIMARVLKAASVTLWKEVDGIMTADPRMEPQARVVPELHYREAAELAYYGAKVLHPRTMVPLIDDGIPLTIRNTFNPDAPGTRVAGDVAAGLYPVKALTAFMGQALIAVEGKGMMGVPGVAARTFGALSTAGHSVSMISQASSEASICLVVPEHEAGHAAVALEEAFAPEIEGGAVDAVRVERKLAVVAVVGMGMRGTPGIAARTFGALSRERINIIAMAQGSSELNITMVIKQDDVPTALQALHREYQLAKLHALGDVEGRRASLVLLGLGQIGRALARQVMEQAAAHKESLGLELATIAVTDRSGVRVLEKGFDTRELAEIVGAKASGAQLVYHRVPRARDTLKELREKVWPLPLHTPILVDLTAADTSAIWLDALHSGLHVVTANKKPLAVEQERFDEVMETARDAGLSIRYEATVGAGLPVLDTLQKLREAGDEVEIILGCLSGTLGYLMTQLEEGTPFSAAVTHAHANGYTEPDPRDDLSGMDVARKALILARTLGIRAELADVAVEALFPPELSDANPQSFLRGLAALDGAYALKMERARKQQKVLRYVARISRKGLQVGLEAVPAASPMGRLAGTDNQVVIHSRRYSTNPLVVTGPGAGADVTAAGVLNDIVAIGTAAERRPAGRTSLQPPRRRHSKSGRPG